MLLGAQFPRPRNSARNSSETARPPSQVDELQLLLPRLLHSPLPSAVDSVCLAGLVDLLRTKGLWYHSVRYGYVFGALKQAGPLLDAALPSRAALESLAAIIERSGSSCSPRAASCTESRRGSPAAPPPPPPRRAHRAAHGRRDVIDAAEQGRAPKAAAGDDEEAITASLLLELEGIVTPLVAAEATRLGLAVDAAAAGAMVRHALVAFAANDLEAAAMQLMRHAKGSFGLVISHSLDATSGLVVAARGQTMSIAVYPQLGMVLFGSEAAATKAAMGMSAEARRADAAERDSPKSLRRDDDGGCRAFAARASPRLTRRRPSATPQPTQTPDRAAELLSLQTAQRDGPERARRLAQLESYRIDLDEVRGEVVALRWDHHPTRSSAGGPRPMEALRAKWAIDDDDAAAAAAAATVGRGGSQLMSWVGAGGGGGRVGKLVAVSHVDGAAARWQTALEQRALLLDGNPLVDPLPPRVKDDPVGRDLADLPSVLKRIADDFDHEKGESLNRITAWAFTNQLKERMLAHARGTHDGSVDLLITGCEVSLWVGEQFASDLLLVFPKLKVVTLSANKILGQLGQGWEIPQAGFAVNGHSHCFRNSAVLLISHSGGTFPTLCCASLLKAFTPHLFAVTSEWDSQVARVVRAGRSAHGSRRRGGARLASAVFTTFAGVRPAEPCSVSVAATHQLLTQLLLYLMYYFKYFLPEETALGGSSYVVQEVQELAALNRQHLTAVEEAAASTSAVGRSLRAQGRRWAQHVLEGPLSWIMLAVYIMATVTAGATPLSAAAAAVGAAADTDDGLGRWAHLVGFVDGIIYLFLPWWTTVLLRLVQRRPWLHRVAGRSLLIGDVPWVAQSLEAFVSKCFALSYSIATINVHSANPLDHLVHRHTHRVTRGALLAIGRPGRPPQRLGLGREYRLPRRQPGVVDPELGRHVRGHHARPQPVRLAARKGRRARAADGASALPLRSRPRSDEPFPRARRLGRRRRRLTARRLRLAPRRCLGL